MSWHDYQIERRKNKDTVESWVSSHLIRHYWSSLVVLAKRPAAKPNGHWISEFSIVKSSNVITVSMLPSKCGDNIPLFDVIGAQSTGNKQERNYYFTEFHSAVTVKRELAASPPVTGTFDILYQNKAIQGTLYATVLSNPFTGKNRLALDRVKICYSKATACSKGLT